MKKPSLSPRNSRRNGETVGHALFHASSSENLKRKKPVQTPHAFVAESFCHTFPMSKRVSLFTLVILLILISRGIENLNDLNVVEQSSRFYTGINSPKGDQITDNLERKQGSFRGNSNRNPSEDSLFSYGDYSRSHCRHTKNRLWWRNGVHHVKDLKSISFISKHSESYEKEKVNSQVKRSVCPVVVVGSTHYALRASSIFLSRAGDIDVNQAQSATTATLNVPSSSNPPWFQSNGAFAAIPNKLGTSSDGKINFEKAASKLADKLLPISLAAKVIKETMTLDYQVDQVSKALQDKIISALDRIRSMVEERTRESKRSVLLSAIGFESAIYLMPFIEKHFVFNALASSSSEPCKPSFLLGVQDGRDASFDKMVDVVREMGPLFTSETVIDNLCLDRVRKVTIGESQSKQSRSGTSWTLPWASNKKAGIVKPKGKLVNPLLSENIRQLEQLEFEDSAESLPGDVEPCNIRDVSMLRAAQLWANTNSEAIKYLSKKSINGFILRTEDINPSNSKNLAMLLNRMGGFCFQDEDPTRPFILAKGNVNGKAQTIKVFLMPYNGKMVRPAADISADTKSLGVPSWKEDAKSHSILVKQIARSIGIDLLAQLGYVTFESEKNRHENKISIDLLENKNSSLERIDAGRCWRDVFKPLTDFQKESLTFPVAHCLPSFLVVGVQKGGTDELAIWLNFNVYHRRLDGGVELHFFDCTGRGKGKKRQMCSRFRDASMTWDSKSASIDEITDGFTWNSIDSSSPYIDDKLWEKYASLGHLRKIDYFKRQTITFEKSPSYFDKANPFDVARLMPSIKIVLLLREPVARLYSGYWQSCTGKLSSRKSCSVANFTSNAEILVSKGLEHVPDYVFKRGVDHSNYLKHIKKWRQVFPDNQILITFAAHFRSMPQAVVHFIEDFVGSSGKRHHIYNPRKQNGYYVLGYYSKAGRPSHKDPLPEPVAEKLREYFRESNRKLRELILSSNMVYKPANIPEQYLNGQSMDLPEWLANS